MRRSFIVILTFSGGFSFWCQVPCWFSATPWLFIMPSSSRAQLVSISSEEGIPGMAENGVSSEPCDNHVTVICSYVTVI